MNLPNKLTLARFFCVPIFMAFLYIENPYTLFLALLIFVGAGITDLCDGYLARKHNLVTPLGVFLDPLADKLIITAALISFVEIPAISISAWMVVLIVGREFVVTGLRALAASQGQIVAADDGGKWKTAVQTATIVTTLVILIVNAGFLHFQGISMASFESDITWRGEWAKILRWTPYWMVFITMLVSLVTGVGYLRKHKHLFRNAT
jgi:CDP-diacylglycerol--glycerol-3-phosphate 3-phosphatidyltransferase